LRDEFVHRGHHFRHAALELPVGLGAYQPPCRKGDHAPEQRREDAVEVALDHVVVGFQGVHLGAERQAGQEHAERYGLGPGHNP